MQAFSFEFTMAAPLQAELVKFEIRLGGTANNPSANTATSTTCRSRSGPSRKKTKPDARQLP